MNRRILLAVSITTFLGGTYLMACGGDDTTNNGGSDGGSDATSQDSGGSDTGTGDDGGSVDSGTSDAKKDTGGGDASDAGGDVQLVGDSDIVTDAGPSGDGATLGCGSAACNVPNQACCVYESPSDQFKVSCSNGTQCPQPMAPDAGDAGDAAVDAFAGYVVSLDCEQNANCTAGHVCCLQHDDSSGKTTASCQLACVSAGPTHAAELCDPSGTIDAGCPVVLDAGGCSSNNIATWHLPNGFGTCGGKSISQ